MKKHIGAIGAGCFVGLASTLVFNILIGLLPDLKPESASVVAQLLNMGEYSAIHYSLIFYICLLAPVAEEYFFRGLFWEFFEGVFNKKVAYLLTTVVFCLAHMELLHIISIMPLSLLFGWLRYKNKSIYFPLLAHMSNNILATIIFIY